MEWLASVLALAHRGATARARGRGGSYRVHETFFERGWIRRIQRATRYWDEDEDSREKTNG